MTDLFGKIVSGFRRFAFLGDVPLFWLSLSDFRAALESFRASFAAFFACLKTLRACFCSIFSRRQCLRAASANFSAAAALAINGGAVRHREWGCWPEEE